MQFSTEFCHRLPNMAFFLANKKIQNDTIYNPITQSFYYLKTDHPYFRTKFLYLYLSTYYVLTTILFQFWLKTCKCRNDLNSAPLT